MKKTIISFFIPKEGEEAENESKWIRFLIPFGLVTLATLGIFGYWGVTTHPNRWLYGVYALPIIGALYSMWNKQNLKSALGDIGAIGIFLVSYYAFFISGWTIPFFVLGVIGIITLCMVVPYLAQLYIGIIKFLKLIVDGFIKFLKSTVEGFIKFEVLIAGFLAKFVNAAKTHTGKKLRLLQIVSFFILMTTFIAYTLFDENLGTFVGNCFFFWIFVFPSIWGLLSFDKNDDALVILSWLLGATLIEFEVILGSWCFNLFITIGSEAQFKAFFLFLGLSFVIWLVTLLVYVYLFGDEDK